MGFRLNIAKEPPTKGNDMSYIFNKEFMISEGGSWELDIFKLCEGNQTVNITRDNCKRYPDCFMCDCSSDTWTYVSIDNLIGKEEIIKHNSNIAVAFLLDDFSEEDFQSQAFCSYYYIIKRKHRDYIWINIS